MRRLRVLLDANVLVDAQVRDLFCRLAEAELIDLRWTSAVLAESRWALEEKLRLDASASDRILAALQRAFPDAMVTGFEHLIEHLALPDPNDRHVLAAAVHGECDVLVTFNIADFPPGTGEVHDLLLASVDDMLVFVAGWFGDRLGEVIDAQLAPLRRPPVSREQFVNRLAVRAPLGAIAVGAALGIDSYIRTYQDVLDAGQSASPHGTVQGLLDALREDRVEDVRNVIDPELARRLTSESEPGSTAIFGALRTQLADALSAEGWGLAAAKRLHGPSREFVKLVHLGSKEPVLITKPTLVRAHLFELLHDGSTWLISDIDGPDPALSEVDPSSLR
jgi:predicted nucleic acid-binding protein